MACTISADEIKRVKALGFLNNKGTDLFNGRIITVNGKITAEQTKVIAEAADKFGNGDVEFTTRLTVEVRGIPFENIEPFREYIAKAGLETGGTGSLVRPVVSCKGTTCQYGLYDTFALSEKIHERFYLGYRTVKLPHKFKIATGGCPNNCVKPDLNDLGIVGQLVPNYDEDMCNGCKKCKIEQVCPMKAAKVEDGVLEIHDWSEYTGKLIEQRENEKNRSRARRAAAKSNDRRTTAGQSADVSKSDQKKTAGRVDQTRVDQSRPENKGDTPITPAAEKQPSAQERRFAEFWTAYPKKVGKKAAQKAWEKAKPDAELFEKIMQAVATAKTSEQWLREGGRFIPNPSTWINQGRWDDEPLPPAGSGSYQQRPGGNCGKPDTMDVLAGIIADEEGGFEI